MAAARKAPAPPTSLRIRAYNVGFGDCFLLTFRYAAGSPRHVLVDFGTTALPANRKTPTMEQIADDIRAECGGHLDMVVATHRHTDHISGFAGSAGRVITSLDPDLVVLPWTEDPALAEDATAPLPNPTGSPGPTPGPPALAARMQRAVSRLDDMHAVAGLVAREAARVAPLSGVPAALAAQLAFLGEENLKNREAVVNLMNLGKKRVYAAHGTKLPVTSVLPGVKIDVLGPPTLKQSKAIEHQASTDPDEFWHLAATTARTVAPGSTAKPIFPQAKKAAHIPQEARWLIPKIDRMNAEELLSIVRILDEAMNNTSLILLFEVGGKLLLFPGDAQIENWRYALQDAPDAAATRTRLAGVHVYKVGHHGSLNATPRKLLWENFARLDAPVPADRMVTLLSTRTGKHGATARGTEVPRTTLLKQLAERTALVDTQDIPAKEFFVDHEVAL